MYIYILRCEDNSLYTGITVDLEKRIRQHLGFVRVKYGQFQSNLIPINKKNTKIVMDYDTLILK